jgi:hypothetical protein
MAGPSPKFSDAQRSAIVRRVLADEVPVSQAVRDAASGKLDDLHAFDVPTSTAQRWVREARNGDEPAHAPALPDFDALERMRARLWTLHLNSLAELEHRQSESTGDEMEERALHLLMLAAVKRQRELEKLTTRPLGPTVTPGGDGADRGDREAAESFLDRLSRETHAETVLQAESESE